MCGENEIVNSFRIVTVLVLKRNKTSIMGHKNNFESFRVL